MLVDIINFIQQKIKTACFSGFNKVFKCFEQTCRKHKSKVNLIQHVQ